MSVFLRRERGKMISDPAFRICSGPRLALKALLQVFLGVALFASRVAAQETSTTNAPSSTTNAPAVDEENLSVANLRELIQEAERANPELAAAQHAWQAATHVSQQASALPETQVFAQQFNVGSPRPFAGYSNSDFAYTGIGISQDLPFPGK